MESLLNRYRNITVLLLVISAQLVLLGYQVKSKQDVRMIRVWAVTAVTPLARVLEGARSGVASLFQNYFTMRDVRAERHQLKREVEQLRVENTFLRRELESADRVKALAQFQARVPSKTLAARVIGTGAGSNSKLIFVDRGSLAGVMKGMAVVTAEGIVGKVHASFPTASQILLLTDPAFAAGVVSQVHNVRGTLRGLGHDRCRVDYVPNEEKVDVGEWFYTSGADRVFPRGFRVGQARTVREGNVNKEIYVEPSALQHGLEEVLIVIEAVHEIIPEAAEESAQVYIGPPPPGGTAVADSPDNSKAGPAATDMDALRERYRAVGEAQGHKFGEGLPGSKPPDFNLKVQPAPAETPATAPRAQPSAPSTAPPAGPPR
jgi:rod shape-determining protein MreC